MAGIYLGARTELNMINGNFPGKHPAIYIALVVRYYKRKISQCLNHARDMNPIEQYVTIIVSISLNTTLLLGAVLLNCSC